MVADSHETTLTHNLRNQLNNIVMNAELAKMELATQSCADPHEPAGGTPLKCVEAILRACAECAGLMDALSELNAEKDQADGGKLIEL